MKEQPSKWTELFPLYAPPAVAVYMALAFRFEGLIPGFGLILLLIFTGPIVFIICIASICAQIKMISCYLKSSKSYSKSSLIIGSVLNSLISLPILVVTIYAFYAIATDKYLFR